MSYEGGLAHNYLKKKAKELLLNKDFKENEIILSPEYRVFIENLPEGMPKISYWDIDVVGINEARKIAVEVGGIDILKISMLKQEGIFKEIVLKSKDGKEINFDEVITIPYENNLPPEFHTKAVENLPEKKKLLIFVYREYIYNKLKDDGDFDFYDHTEENSGLFYHGRYDA